MAKKYSEVRDQLQIEVNTRNCGNEMAFLTHYLQNHKNGVSQYFKPDATEYLVDLYERLELAEEPNLNTYLPIKWDVPFPPPENPKFKFIDLFAGIGGIRMAYQNLGGKCVFTSEWNNYAKKTYEANFGEVPFGDITKVKVSEIPDHDLLL